ncbi:MAG: CRISPR-associated endonuclease Cas2 [Ruminococcaceae bacterium]|nr:CRISPR-associated endonuclease Cas2 [Oscillospiraceae bacterium]
MFLKNELELRKLPPIPEEGNLPDKRRARVLDILQKEIYGERPPAPDFVQSVIEDEGTPADFAGKARLRKIRLTVSVLGGTFSFPFRLVFPTDKMNLPFVVLINFRPDVPDKYLPAEELLDRGIGFASLYYEDVTKDNNDFTDGFAGFLAERGIRCGKISMWAYCASLILDYILENESVDRERLAVAGHSRLGKTALLAGAFDLRFTHVYSNNSGCGGAAIARGKNGETVEKINERYGYWFCEKYKTYAGREAEMPFDQHFLLAAIAPRKIYVASAAADSWADPVSEYLNCAAVSSYYEALGKTGFISADRLPEIGDVFHAGDIGYHLRAGEHYLSRADWNLFLQFFLQ